LTIPEKSPIESVIWKNCSFSRAALLGSVIGFDDRQLRTICGDGHARIIAELNGTQRRAVGVEREPATAA
jgi:hypothetical protein